MAFFSNIVICCHIGKLKRTDQVIKRVLSTEWFKIFTSSRAQRLSREFFWIGLGRFAAVSGAVVGVRLLTELMEPSIYGQLALGMTVATLMQQVILGPLSNGATRFYAPAREAGTLLKHLSSVKSLVLKVTIAILLATIVACLGLILIGQSKWISLCLAAICFAILSGYNSILNGMQNAARQRSIVALHQGLLSWGRFLLAAGMVLCLGSSSTVAMLGYALAVLIVLGSQRWFFLKTLKGEGVLSVDVDGPDREWGRQIIVYAWPFATWGLLGWASLAVDRWSLQIFASSSEVGRYAALFQLGYYPIFMLQTMGTQLLAPIYFQRVGDASDPSRTLKVYIFGWRITLFAVLLTVVVAIACFFLHKIIFALLVAKDYAAISKMLPGMVLAAGLTASAQFCTILLHAKRSTSFLIVPKNVSNAVGVVLMLMGAAWYGVLGIIVAKIIYSVIHLIWIMSLVRHQYKLLQTTASGNQVG